MSDKVIAFGKASESHGDVKLPLAFESIEAGFPSPNGGYIDSNLDVNEFLVSHPNTTYIYRVSGDSMIDAGILPDDYVLVDSSVEPRSGDIVVVQLDGEYTIKELRLGDRPMLVARNPNFSPIAIEEHMQIKIIGPVISVVRKYN